MFVFGQADRPSLPCGRAHLAEQLYIGGDETGLLRLGEGQIETIVNAMVELTGNSYGARRQPGRTYERAEETGQIGADLTHLRWKETI